MKPCSNCNNKRNGLKKFALVQQGVLKMQSICNQCRLDLDNIDTPMLRMKDGPVDIQQIIKKLQDVIKNKEQSAASSVIDTIRKAN